MTTIEKIRKGLDTGMLPVSAILFLIGTGSTALGTIVRTLKIGFDVSWVEEVTRYTIIWGVLLLVGYGFRRGIHTQFDVLQKKLKGKTKGILILVLQIISMFFFAILLIGGIQLVIASRGMVSACLQIPMALPYLAIPVCAVFVEIELLMMCIEVICEYFVRHVDITEGGEK